MAKQWTQERQEAADMLREWLKPGDTVYTILWHCSRSGMLRLIAPLLLPTDDRAWPRYLGFLTAKVLDWRDDGDQGVKVGGCGMDMGFHLVYELSRALFPGGFQCIGKGCPANDHSNGDRDYSPHQHRNGGYALTQKWL